MLETIDRLRQIKQRCLSCEPLSNDLSRWIGSALQDFLEQRSNSVDAALGLRFPQGGVPWWREEAIRVRDGVLRSLARDFLAELTRSAQAKQIATLSVRYAASAWRHDREHCDMPERYRGKVKEYLWLAFTSGATMPIGERQLRNILEA